MVARLIGIGLAELTQRALDWFSAQGLRQRTAQMLSSAALLCCWSLVAHAAWSGPAIATLRQLAHDSLVGAQFAGRLPQLCGIGLYGLDGHDWAWYGGYSYLHRPVPMYWPKDAAELRGTVRGFDTLLYREAAPPPELGFTTERCFGRICLARRPGPRPGAKTTPRVVPALRSPRALGALSSQVLFVPFAPLCPRAPTQT